jgi:hypothetical protein
MRVDEGTSSIDGAWWIIDGKQLIQLNDSVEGSQQKRKIYQEPDLHHEDVKGAKMVNDAGGTHVLLLPLMPQ